MEMDILVSKTVISAEVDGFGIKLKFDDGSVFNYNASDGGYSGWEITESDGITELPGINQEVEDLKSNAWIPCEERLPKFGQRALVCTVEDGILLAEFRWAYDDEIGDRYNEWTIVANEYCDVRLYDDDIIAWMPLPEPYKGEQ